MSIPFPSFEVLRDRYFNDLRVKNWSEATIVRRHNSLGRFVRWLRARSIDSFAEVTVDSVNAYQRSLFHLGNLRTRNPLRFATQSSYLTAVAHWCQWACLNNFLPFNPAVGIEKSEKVSKKRKGVRNRKRVRKSEKVSGTEKRKGAKSEKVSGTESDERAMNSLWFRLLKTPERFIPSSATLPSGGMCTLVWCKKSDDRLASNFAAKNGSVNAIFQATKRAKPIWIYTIGSQFRSMRSHRNS